MGSYPSTPAARLRNCLVGANPIIWSNDDFAELAGDVPLDTILSEMRLAGFSGSELGHAYPRSPGALADALGRHELRLVSGWRSTYLASRPFEEEETGFRAHLNLLKTLGARVAIVAECTRCLHGDPHAPLGFGDDSRPQLHGEEWPRLTQGLQRLCEISAEEDIQVVYHHHMGTVIQSETDLERVLASVPALKLVLDPGHLAFAGIVPAVVARRYAKRIGHVHLKSVRPEVVARAEREHWSFYRAVAEGVFTIPGDGAVDFPALFALLAAVDYRGWLVVEAEEDPRKVPALPKARRARAYVREHAGV